MLKNSNLKIALYIRVSTEEQAENPEGPIKSQEQRLREAVNYRNRQSSFGEIVSVYIDAGISAKDMKRPKLQEMLMDVRLKKINFIMVTEISRLSRNNRDFFMMWDMLRDNKCSFMSLREDFDTTTSAGEMLLCQIVNFSQFERKQTSERVVANLLARSKRGLYNGGSVPLGLQTIPNRPGYLEIDPDHAPTVKKAFQVFLKEGSLSPTARWLNDNGYKPKKHLQGGGSKMRVGHFTVDNLHLILTNKAYIGLKVFSHKGETHEAPAVWDAIIDEVVFRRVNELLAKNRARLKPIKENRHPYILSGVSFCMTCGDHMSGKSATGRNGKVAYYEHSWATKRESCLTKKTFKCDPHRVLAKRIEPVVWDEFCKLLSNEKFIKHLLNKVKEKHLENDEQQERARYKAKLYGVNSQIDALAERIGILPKGISPTPLFNQLEKIQNAKKEIEEKLMSIKEINLDQRLVPLETFNKFAEFSKKVISENSDFNIRRQILQKFVKRVEIGPDCIKIHWNVDKEFYTNEVIMSSKREFSQADACDSSYNADNSNNLKNNRNVG
ncbi:MAG: recombinase family protein [Bacteriovorax sp.]|nr:recombinase family protein [Bacteriovorax sp.]